jgi:hypothetical protein
VPLAAAAAPLFNSLICCGGWAFFHALTDACTGSCGPQLVPKAQQVKLVHSLAQNVAAARAARLRGTSGDGKSVAALDAVVRGCDAKLDVAKAALAAAVSASSSGAPFFVVDVELRHVSGLSRPRLPSTAAMSTKCDHLLQEAFFYGAL